MSFRFRLRRLLVAIAICAALIAVIASIVRHELSAWFVVEKVRSLNGSVGKNYPPDEVSFSLVGKPSPVGDADLEELAPYLGEFGLRKIGLGHTKVTNVGLRAVITHCRDTLEILGINGSDISDDALVMLAECPKLRHLALSASQLTDRSIKVLARTASLRSIVVYGAFPDDHRVIRLKMVLGTSIAVEAYKGRD